MRHSIIAAATILISTSSLQADDTQTEFMASLQGLCGQAFEGKVISSDAADTAIAKETLVMHVRECSDTEIKIPFHVGKNRSRTWVISMNGKHLTLKHDHRHEDGVPDKVTQYGGTTATKGTNVRQEFPADDFSKTMFQREGLTVSVDNVWAVEVEAGKHFIYELSRPNRLFRVSFDLTAPITPPPAPWGHE
ncbi:hypothetical protein [Kordiimonas sp. SCSIO 12610]|uniref:hypothetical protein n=1 Tax=Kordiimonas sp. SCSIO 12610 TaxID=2829597 RepID=UPI00210CD4E7|nr:hypothetical protein [Kordiimonas sp. SCSIO 12610]UTW55998.1 hypothetical protein KFF44_03645 [Kordiimonas sp. SCSIO 12610]